MEYVNQHIRNRADSDCRIPWYRNPDWLDSHQWIPLSISVFAFALSVLTLGIKIWLIL